MTYRMTTLLALAGAVATWTVHGQKPAAPACDPDNGGLTLPPGFCAQVIADDLGARPQPRGRAQRRRLRLDSHRRARAGPAAAARLS